MSEEMPEWLKKKRDGLVNESTSLMPEGLTKEVVGENLAFGFNAAWEILAPGIEALEFYRDGPYGPINQSVKAREALLKIKGPESTQKVEEV